MKMPMILDCNMNECAYNINEACHAMAITVGGAAPTCDTFVRKSHKGGVLDTTGSVGACKEDKCKFNDSLECTASGIHVSIHADHAECDTFSSM
jgi:hypothetical protein